MLDRFPAYWDAGNIHFARVIYLPIVNSTAKLANLQSGTVDMAERLQPTDADAVRADQHLRLLIYPWLGYQSINFNVAHGARANTPLGRDAPVLRTRDCPDPIGRRRVPRGARGRRARFRPKGRQERAAT